MGFIRVTYSLWLGQFSPKSGYVSSPKLLLGFWKIPGQLVVFSLHWILNPEEVGLARAKECFCSRTDELASASEGKQAKGKVAFFHGLLCGLSPGGVAQI